MTRLSTPSILSELRNASSPASQAIALRALKHDIIGHQQKKEIWIRHGVLAPIARILNSYKGNGKRKHRDTHDGSAQSKQRSTRSDGEEARLQAINIIGSLANGGPAFIPAIQASSVVAQLLLLLSPSESSPQLVLAALKALNAVADSLLLCHLKDDGDHEGLLGLLYTEQNLATVAHLLLQTSHSWTVQQQVALSATLISKTCHEEHHRAMLAQAGVLEAFACRVTSFMVATGCQSKTEYHSYHSPVHQQESDKHSTSSSRLSIILQAINSIIIHSQSRASQFLCAPAFSSIFQNFHNFGTYESKSNLWDSVSNRSATRQSSRSSIEQLLPSLPSTHYRGSSLMTSNFPSLGSLSSSKKQSQTSRSFSSAVEVTQNQGLEFLEHEESPLIGWLLHIVRAEDELTGLTAAMLLAILYQQGLIKPSKESAFALLLVPTLSRMLDKDLKISLDAAYTSDIGIASSPEKFIKEQAPSILSMLTANNPEVQKAAADAGVIKKLSQLLKESYDENVLSSSPALWTPQAPDAGQTDGQVDGRETISKLGPKGMSPAICHVVRLREAVLTALAAIASDKDEYRKAIIENGVIPFIIRTLKPQDIDRSSATQGLLSTTMSILTDNSKHAILAACGVAKALSRSVSILRTSLMDAGLTAPLFVLLKHQDIDLQIAATAVVCNLVLPFSPMQEAIIEAGALKILCEHAHSLDTNLRLSSVWALKHLILQASNEVKMGCLEELGPGWLQQIVKNDVELPYPPVSTRGDKEEGPGTPIRMSTPNAAGEQVDLLNATEGTSRASSQEMEDGGEDLKMVDSIGALSRVDPDAKRSGPASQRETGQNTAQRPSYQSISDELAIQIQGLDLLRNLLCGTGASDMIDFVFRELGQDKLFEMLAAKLRPRIINAFNRERRASESGVRHSMPHMEIVLSICYIIVHIAAGDSRQRQLLIAQTELLKLIIPLFSHPDPEIRSCCVWICINLTWQDNDSDKVNCKARARELAKLGVYEKLEQMENDPVSDVRERSKTALSLART